MSAARLHGRMSARGMALLLTLSFLAMFACLIVSLAVMSDMNMMVARNRTQSRQAEALAEAGLNLVQVHLGGASVSGTGGVERFHQEIAAHLDPVWASLAHTADGASYDASAVSLATIRATAGGTGAGTVDIRISADRPAADSPTITVQSTGRFGGAARTAFYEMTAQPGMSVLGAYGIASKSAINMKGNPSIVGANRTEEGSVLSATAVTLEAIDLTGHVNISGDVAVTNPDALITTKGNVNIGGERVRGAIEPDWPEVDAGLFAPYATHVYTGSEGTTLTNIRIPAGKNPTFNANMQLRGVIYIESPNKVTFNGNCNVAGVIVAEKPLTTNYDNNRIKFAGTVTSAGVETLSRTEFGDLCDLKGSFLLAEGYSLTFTGNFNTVNGYIVGSKFEFSGNAGGTVRGGIINLADTVFTVDGNVDIVIDKEHAEDDPAGLVSKHFLLCVAGSYHE